MCKPRVLIAAGIAATALVSFTVGYGAAVAFGPRPGDKLSQSDADRALAYVRQRLPNTPFSRAAPYAPAPWLVELRAGPMPEPLYFDPLHHALLVGLVVDLEDPSSPIAPGRLAGGKVGE